MDKITFLKNQLIGLKRTLEKPGTPDPLVLGSFHKVQKSLIRLLEKKWYQTVEESYGEGYKTSKLMHANEISKMIREVKEVEIK